jgi:hypothetical protein
MSNRFHANALAGAARLEKAVRGQGDESSLRRIERRLD